VDSGQVKAGVGTGVHSCRERQLPPESGVAMHRNLSALSTVAMKSIIPAAEEVTHRLPIR
jgi:hypothetical protein